MKPAVFIATVHISQALGAIGYLGQRDGCASGYTFCAPAGAMTIQVPKINDTMFQSLFVDLVDSSLPDGNTAAQRSIHDGVAGASLCCVSSLTCLTMSNLLIPFCYDRFTTNYFLPDDSYGTIVTGSYATSAGDSANLLSGDYTLEDGTKGNIYAKNEAAKPNTATLHLPSQFTGHGVGSAVPASVLGAVVTITYTTVLPGTTVPPSTIHISILSVQVVSGSTLPARTQTSALAGSIVASTEGATTETILEAGSKIISTIPQTIISMTPPGSTITSFIPATSIPVSTISATTIEASTVPGTTVGAVKTTLIATIPAGQDPGTLSSNSASSTSGTRDTTSYLRPRTLAYWVCGIVGFTWHL